MKLSIGMMVKNEEKHLEQCLRSLTPILDRIDSELIIVDTGSNDKTVDIAKKFTDKVYFHKWNNNFAEMRNISISYCCGEWFFCIDGDETVEDCSEIINFFNSGEYKNYKSATCNIKNLTDLRDENSYSVLPSLRMFKKDKEFKFIGVIHNQPIFKGPTKTLNAWIKHYGYISTDKELMEKKFKRTSEILKRELMKDPGNVYYMYQLSVSYSMHDDKEDAVAEIEKAYAYIKENKINICEYICVLQQLCLSYLNTNNYFEVIKCASEWLIYDKNSIDAHFSLGYSYFMLSENKEAINYMEKYVAIIEDNKFSMNNTGVMTYFKGKIDDVYYYLSLLYGKMNDTEKAMYYLLKIKCSKHNIIQEIISLCVHNKYYNELFRYYNNLSEKKDKSEIDKFFLYIECEKLRLEKRECNKITKLFAKGNNLYNKLNCLRISYENNDENFAPDIDNFINKESLVNLPDYYGDLVFYLIDLKENISNKLKGISYKVLNNYLDYISIKYEDFSDKVYEYLKIYGDKEDFDSLKINKELLRYIILLNKLDNERFKYAFLNYIDTGIKYINKVYSPFILENGMYQECRTAEEGFLIFMGKAKQYEISDKKLYLQCLSKALGIYPNMKDGVKLLLGEANKSQNIDNEMELYKKKVKKSISEFIELNNIDKAKALIHEYEDIINDDPEIYSMKAVIAILEKKYTEAEKLLKKGLILDNKNFDLFYNLGYLYDIENRKIESEAAFTITKILCKDDSSRRLVDKSLLRISKKRTKIYNVILYGRLEECIELEKVFKEWNIIGYIVYGDNNVNNEKIISLKGLSNYNYDFILAIDKENQNEILKEFLKYGINHNIYMFSDFRTSVIEGFDYRIRELLAKSNIDTVITGSSYAEVGIKAEGLNTNAINFAFSSQDLFYDYQIINYLLNFVNVKNSFKFAIIGLSYYCFDYDMSKSIAKYRVQRYTDYIDNLHYNKDKIGVDITKLLYRSRLGFKEYYKMNKVKENTIVRCKDKEQEYIAQKNANMNYSIIRKENIDIFSEYLCLLRENNIKPIIVICPVSKYYRKYFRDGYQKDKFYRIMDEFKTEYDFQIIDYFDSNLFQDSDFWDYGHLNGKGSEKFTDILNNEIRW